jgi:hypothetical protein
MERSPLQKKAENMFKFLKIAFRVIWATCMMVSCVALGVAYGWHLHGWMGAIALGFAGLVAGTFFGYSPEFLLQMLHGI